LTVTHAINDDQIKLTLKTGTLAQGLKKAVSKLVKRGPPDHISLANAQGKPLRDGYRFTADASVFCIGVDIGPPKPIRVRITDNKTFLHRVLEVLDTCTVAQVTTEVPRALGVAEDDVRLWEETKDMRFITVTADLPDTLQLQGEALLNGCKRFILDGGQAGLIYYALEDVIRLLDALYEVYIEPDFQARTAAFAASHPQFFASQLPSLKSKEALGASKSEKAVDAATAAAMRTQIREDWAKLFREVQTPIAAAWGFDVEFVDFAWYVEAATQPFQKDPEVLKRAAKFASLSWSSATGAPGTSAVAGLRRGDRARLAADGAAVSADC